MRKVLLVITLVLLSLTKSPQAFCQEYSSAATSYYNAGIDYYQSKSYNAAIASFQKAIEIEPEFIDAYYNLGAVYEYLGENEKAIQTYAKLLRLNPKDYDAMYETAKAYYKQANYNIAIKYLSDIPQTHKRYQQALILKSKANEKLTKSKTDSAITTNKEQITNKSNTIAPNTANKITQTQTPQKTVIGKYSSPTGIAIDTLGNIYIANYSNDYITKITPDKKCHQIGKSQLIKGPIGLAIDKQNNIYIANYEGNTISKISPAGKIVTLISKINKPYCL